MKTIFIFCFVFFIVVNIFSQDYKLKTGLIIVNENESCTDTSDFTKINYSDEKLCVDNKPILTDSNFDSIKVNIDTTSYALIILFSLSLTALPQKLLQKLQRV